MIISGEQLVAWEERAVRLDEHGVSEAYFPTWGFAQAQDYVAFSRACQAQAAANDAARCDAGSAMCVTREAASAVEAALVSADGAPVSVTVVRGDLVSYEPPSRVRRAVRTVGLAAGRIVAIVAASAALTVLANWFFNR